MTTPLAGDHAGCNDHVMDRLDRFVADLPHLQPGPGGAIAVLRAGQVLVRHAWGFANAEARIPFTPASLFRICSITKQFTCATALDRLGAPEALDAAVAARLPGLGAAAPAARLLMHNQSGLRDYWAEAMLQGSPAEGPFGPAEAARLIGAARSLHFAPGSRASYVNQNFRLLSDALEDVTGESFATLLRRHILDPVGMQHAILAADTRALPDGTEGYEGSQASGFRPAVNRILWTGDAGIAASLDDLIAWERAIDASRDDPRSLHGRLTAPVTFADGNPAAYGFGLGRAEYQGRRLLAHGGALRGWRSHRFYVPSERVSVVVLFNHMADAQAVALGALAALLDLPPAPAPQGEVPEAWMGSWIEPETGLAARIAPAGPGRLRLSFGQGPETLVMAADGSASQGRTRLSPQGGALWMERSGENLSTPLLRADGPAPADIDGEWRCAETGARLSIAAAGGVLYGAFGGQLGQGRMELLEPIGRDLWVLPCPRALDVAPPGEWTLAVQREAGQATALRIGCWLARGLTYRRG